MKRRDLLGLIGAAAISPIPSRAQKPVPLIGYMSGGSASFYAPILPAFHDGLRESGYVEGQNVRIEYRWAEGDYDKLPAFAADFVSSQVNLIAATGGNRSPFEAKKATPTIPIVFTSGDDPVAVGLVAGLAHPGGNLTGVSFLTIELHPKRLELISDLIPHARTIGLLVYPNAPATQSVIDQVTAAAKAKGVRLEIEEVRSDADFEPAFASLKAKADALIVQTDPFIDARRDRLVALAGRYSIPAIYGFRQFAIAGGLISFGTDLDGVYRQVGVYAGKILSGAKPADLPVVQPTRFELVINLKTAKGITVPQSLLTRADEVIE